MVIGGRKLKLKSVKVPIYNLATREDHIAPAKSVLLGSKFFGGPVRFVLAGSGHIAGVVNPPGKMKYQYWTGPSRRAPASTPGSKRQRNIPAPGGRTGSSGSRRRTRPKFRRASPAAAKLVPIEDAPGRYVKVRD